MVASSVCISSLHHIIFPSLHHFSITSYSPTFHGAESIAHHAQHVLCALRPSSENLPRDIQEGDYFRWFCGCSVADCNKCIGSWLEHDDEDGAYYKMRRHLYNAHNVEYADIDNEGIRDRMKIELWQKNKKEVRMKSWKDLSDAEQAAVNEFTIGSNIAYKSEGQGLIAVKKEEKGKASGAPTSPVVIPSPPPPARRQHYIVFTSHCSLCFFFYFFIFSFQSLQQFPHLCSYFKALHISYFHFTLQYHITFLEAGQQKTKVGRACRACRDEEGEGIEPSPSED